jgi:hypothetical protein
MSGESGALRPLIPLPHPTSYKEGVVVVGWRETGKVKWGGKPA